MSRVLACAVLGIVQTVVSHAETLEQGRPESVCAGADEILSVSLGDAIVQSLRSEPHLIMARQDVIESKADVTAALAPFLPKAQIAVDEERFVPSNGFAPVTVVGNNILGGSKTYSAYGSIAISWNILSSGRDVAGYKGAQAQVRASKASLYGELDDTLTAVLKGYAEVYQTKLNVDQQRRSLDLLKEIERRAEERYEHGDGTTIAIGQSREAALDAERTLNDSCRSLTEKSAALAKAMGVRLPVNRLLVAASALPEAPAQNLDARAIDSSVESDPSVVSANEKITAAEQKLKQTHAAFGPTMSIDARRDYLGQEISSLSAANNIIAPNSYRIGVSFSQPIFPFAAEMGAMWKAKAEVRRAQAATDQARIDADGKLRIAVSASLEAEGSYRAAKSNLLEAQRVLTLTESLRQAGRTDQDGLTHARIDLQKAQAESDTLLSQALLAKWELERSFRATQFPTVLLSRLNIELAELADDE
jgi:outer membrane protein TolC